MVRIDVFTKHKDLKCSSLDNFEIFYTQNIFNLFSQILNHPEKQKNI